ncbi:UDP-glucose 4-epimerase GalE [Hamadaea sp. NPDC050747]|uniref:UDP-glucose 4-epimerase GalE n=1 Tax=Hamadaea sp. NPDC050747 TaxID=3155789 RepID=UPI0033CF39D3
MKVLITGGAGFIGSTIASALIDAGLTPVVLDNLSSGREEFTAGRIFYRGDIGDGTLVDEIFAEHPEITAVVHCAGLIVVPESVREPLRYYRENVSKSIDMIEHLTRNGCRRIVFSSTAALYRATADMTVDENSPTQPLSPYARTKAFVEDILADCAAAGELKAISLRYFNPIGADPQMRTGLQVKNPSHALGRMIKAYEAGEPFAITGVGWPTRDGTAIRDYLHIWDLAEAHVAALMRFDDVVATSPSGYVVINIGGGKGTTVYELLNDFNVVIDAEMPYQTAGRRPGDILGAYTRTERSARLLGWVPKLTIEDGIRHALEWRSRDRGGLSEADTQPPAAAGPALAVPPTTPLPSTTQRVATTPLPPPPQLASPLPPTTPFPPATSFPPVGDGGADADLGARTRA